jgi:hypothetical protein
VTVAELITRLSALPPSLPVILNLGHDEQEGAGEAGRVTVVEAVAVRYSSDRTRLRELYSTDAEWERQNLEENETLVTVVNLTPWAGATTVTATTAEPFNLWTQTLEAVYRLRPGVDYCTCEKYGERFVLVNEINVDAVLEAAERCGLELVGVFPFRYRGQREKAVAGREPTR